ncbi:alpha/beta hydrolase [Sphingobium sp. Ant17]|uniref:alpha/beta hydrolase family protein n=1 Tax=Sphingobium sp. Ant17 TaxID=1461752 RepID=UPI0009DF01F2
MRYRSLGLATVLIVTSTAWAQTPSDNQHALIGPPQLHALPVTAPTLVEAYGPDPLQIGELRLPAGPDPFPVVMVIHGGCWTKGYETLAGTAPLASALTDKGVATWNIEYRQVGDTRGGWPGTFQDWGAALDHLRVLARTQPLDLKHVVTVGHSAGAHAALWLAARPRLPADSEVRGADPLKVSAAVAIDGPGDLRTCTGSTRIFAAARSSSTCSGALLTHRRAATVRQIRSNGCLWPCLNSWSLPSCWSLQPRKPMQQPHSRPAIRRR